MKILITGGAGFIGSALIRYLIEETKHSIINVDCLTYAGNLYSLPGVEDSGRYSFEKVNICDRRELDRIFGQHKPDVVMHLAAESHVDRSISGPLDFIQTNVVGTATLLESARTYLSQLDATQKEAFRFHHISTDEVYGDLHGTDSYFTETTAYAPSSPYSASKASSDHLVRAWHRTYGFPVLITNCSNNYGPYQFPEKLIPVIVLNALQGKALPIYGNGLQVRDWLYVEDHARALYAVLTGGRVGQTYNIGGNNEKKNIDVVQAICHILDGEVADRPNGITSFSQLITYVKDRPGHDLRYAIDASKIQQELGWQPIESFESGIRKTVLWYLRNSEWCRQIFDGSYREANLSVIKNGGRI